MINQTESREDLKENRARRDNLPRGSNNLRAKGKKEKEEEEVGEKKKAEGGGKRRKKKSGNIRLHDSTVLYLAVQDPSHLSLFLSFFLPVERGDMDGLSCLILGFSSLSRLLPLLDPWPACIPTVRLRTSRRYSPPAL